MHYCRGHYDDDRTTLHHLSLRTSGVLLMDVILFSSINIHEQKSIEGEDHVRDSNQ
jgi:hypothetical protein